jgi:hypothetical protein
VSTRQPSWVIGARAAKKKRAKRATVTSTDAPAQDGTRFDPAKYISETLGYSAWSGENGATGQAQIIDHYKLVLLQLHERRDYEQGKKAEAELIHWSPGQAIQNWISVDAGHNVGKTTCGAFIVNHFFDSFPSIGYCFAPSSEQINDLLFKEIRVQRRGKNLPGQALEGEPRIKHTEDHFVKGKATDNSNNSGTERTHGQHHEYLIFVIDEAEGVPGYVYDSVRSMASGGIAVVIVLRNPRTTTCEAHKIRKADYCKSFRISCFDHPNVIYDREIVSGSIRRQYILDLLTECEVVSEHDPDEYTFELPWQPGTIYRPSPKFLWRVLGIAGGNLGLRCFVPSGRYDAAVSRKPVSQNPHVATLGLDCQRDGSDLAPLFVRHDGAVWCAKVFQTEAGNEAETTYKYSEGVKEVALELKRKSCGVGKDFTDWKTIRSRGITSLHVRVDAGGGFGAGPVDRLKRIQELIDAFPDFQVIEVKFGSSPKDEKKYYDCITELTADAAESLKGLALINPPAALEQDLTERKYDWRNVAREEVKKLEEKDKFRKEHGGRSPDYGDSFVMAVAGEWLFSQPVEHQPARSHSFVEF